MLAHPAFSSRPAPERATFAGFDLAPLAPGDLDAMMTAIGESEARLLGLFGDDWPRGLTREEVAMDLGWHAKEFALQRSFAWSLREGGVLGGCVHLLPHLDAPDRGTAVLWLRTGWEGRTDAVEAALRDWFAGPDWPPLELDWQVAPG